MITISELSPAVKNRVVELFDRDAFRAIHDPQTMRAVVTGLAVQTLNKKYNGIFGDGVSPEVQSRLTGGGYLDELQAERNANFSSYTKMALDIYENVVIAELNEVLGELGRPPITSTPRTRLASLAASTPDATGNDLEPSAVCPHCGEDH